MKYVIVEDEIRIREGIRKLLKKLNEQDEVVGEAENGKMGLEIIKKYKPDIVITDIKMPVMDGLQLLEQLHKEKIDVKAIVLSAYTEFEYARTAMKLGVTEYLLKPISLSDFTHAIEHSKEQIEHEKLVKPEQIGNLEQVLKGLLSGDIILEEEVLNYLKKNYDISDTKQISILTVYSEQWKSDKMKRLQQYLISILSERKEIKYCILKNEEAKSFQIFLYGFTDSDKTERWFQLHFLQQHEEIKGFAMGWAQAENIGELKREYDEMCSYLDWNIALGDNILISYPKVKQIQTTLCIYPIKLESEMRVAVCSMNKKKIEKAVSQFISYFQEGIIYEPIRIKECYIRYFWALINLAREIGMEGYQCIEQQVLLDKIMRARTTKELHAITLNLVEQLETPENDTTDNITIKRMRSLIHEFYQEGITLDEIAEKMDMTPEYIGTLFRKETGMNYSNYIKKYRICKAKELLVGTQLKLYEISQKTGFSDPKYFSKVFKEVTGQLPADYRKLHK